jgi:hypothetical protein
VTEHDHLDGQLAAVASAEAHQLEDSDQGDVEKRQDHDPVSSFRAVPRNPCSEAPDDIRRRVPEGINPTGCLAAGSRANVVDGRPGGNDAFGDCCFLVLVRYLGFLVPSVLLKNVLMRCTATWYMWVVVSAQDVGSAI